MPTLSILSLSLSLNCALVATLTQQWSRNSLQMAQEHRSDRTTQDRLRLIMSRGFMRVSRAGISSRIISHSIFLVFLGMIDFSNSIVESVISVSSSQSRAPTYISPYSLLPQFPLSNPVVTARLPPGRFSSPAMSALHWLVFTVFPL